jgi:cellulose synthase/poly-beta-1,6-N-acetylglucosamine synthase-like glycosyltransferase
VVYDAEDRPARDQIRRAAERFAADPALDCLQARLAVDNAGDSWLARMFAVEYAMLFDLINPGLAALRLPVALGGSSNFFRIRALREAGGWDAWNVTEDADLGLRFARMGMSVETLASDTLEEAPHEWPNWFRQRVRWQKGWMQTLIVHLRRPRRALSELGVWRSLAAFAMIAGAVAGGLFGAMFMIETIARLIASALLPSYFDLWYGDIVTIGLLLWGMQSVVVPAMLVMRRRRMPGITRVILTMPLYFVAITLASWTALFELIFRPFHWGKTDHGRAKARAAQGAAATLSGKSV